MFAQLGISSHKHRLLTIHLSNEVVSPFDPQKQRNRKRAAVTCLRTVPYLKIYGS